MGTLRRLSDQSEVPMPARLLVGRAHTAHLRLQTVVASGEHASIVWTGDHWEIRDLGSTNGTLVDQQRLDPGKPRRIARGAQLMFGGPSEQWELSSDEAPDALAVELDTGTIAAARAQLLALPTPSEPKVSVYQSPGGDWVAELEDGELRRVYDQGLLEVGGRSWRLHLPMQVEGTPMIEPQASLENVSFSFRATPSGELLDITLRYRGKTAVLEARGHGYVLLVLARARQSEQKLPVSERGWVEREELLNRLTMDANSLNVAIHRARAQLLAAGISNAQGIVEVRRGERRLGTDRFEIVTV